jgi:hypothetical protein
MAAYEVKMSDGQWVRPQESEADGTSVWCKFWFGWKEFRNAAESDNIRLV